MSRDRSDRGWVYDQDGLRTIHNSDFMEDPKFIDAFNRGMDAHGRIENIHWRVHVVLWVAEAVKRLEGDFVECGVNKGMFSTCVMKYLNWNSNCLNKHFYLFDTFKGLDPRYVTDEEKKRGVLETFKPIYSECYELAQKNFEEFRDVHLIRGSIPETLTDVKIDKVCYLSIDMNCVIPEIAAAEFFWPKMVKGSIAILDDYAYWGYEEQKKAFTKFAQSKNISILHLPTGQGMYIKP